MPKDAPVHTAAVLLLGVVFLGVPARRAADDGVPHELQPLPLVRLERVRQLGEHLDVLPAAHLRDALA